MEGFLKSALLLLVLVFQVLSHAQAHSVDHDFSLTRRVKVVVPIGNYYQQMAFFNQNGFDVAGVDFKSGQIDLIVTEEQYLMLKSKGVNLEVHTIQEEAMLDPQYKNPDEIQAFLSAIQTQYPNITQMVEIGRSIENRPIWAMKISDNVKMRFEYDEPTIFFNSMHHAREVMTPEIAIDIIQYLTAGYGRDEKVTHWVNANEIWIIPMVNVDGNNKVWNSNNMWRKNNRGNYGVDINRNYPYKWGECNGSSGSRYSETFRGDAAGSEPETQAMMNFISQIRPVFSISFHSYSELVLYPGGCQGERAINKDVVEPIGKKLGQMLGYTAGTSWEILYSVDGGDIDWMNSEFQTIPYVLEVNSTREGFQPSYNQWRDVTVNKVRVAWMYLLDMLDGPAVRGVVRGIHGQFENKYVVDFYRKDARGNYHYYHRQNSHWNGTFHVVLPPGDYKMVTINTNGEKKEKDITVENYRKNIAIE
ncbi:MAG: zinc carboxypeptidase [Bacteriovoracaceae bacterium]|nr:zinc carboxypeptidase [Bacteriovoracaceae bacterium]